MCAPCGISVIAALAPITAGSPSSLARTAAWLIGPPSEGLKVGDLAPEFAFDRSDGSPFQGPFRYRSVVGYRDAGPDVARPVECGESLTIGTGDTLCHPGDPIRHLPEKGGTS